MANIFGVDIETPQETQRRILEEQLKKQQALGRQSAAGQVGSAIGKALSNMFGAEANQMKQTKARQEALQGAAVLKDQLLKEMSADPKTSANRGITDEIDVEIRARAHAAATLRSLGGADNTALANQLTDQNTALMVQQKQRQAEMQRLKAQTESSQQQTVESKRRVFESLDISDLRAEQELNSTRLSDSKFVDSPAGEELIRRQQKIGDRIEELRTTQYIPLRGVDAQELGLSQEQLEAYAGPDGIPVETFDRLVRQQQLRFQQTKLSPRSERIVEDAWTARQAAKANSRSAMQIRSDLQTVTRAEGVGLTIQETVAKLYGADADVTQLQAEINRVLLGEAISRRPPGPLSERELDLLRETTVNPDADANQLIGAFTTTARIAEYNARYEDAKIDHLNNNRNMRGFKWDADSEWAQIEKDIPSPPGTRTVGEPSGDAAAPPPPANESPEDRRARLLGGD
jgi:hypothetical protein